MKLYLFASFAVSFTDPCLKASQEQLVGYWEARDCYASLVVSDGPLETLNALKLASGLAGVDKEAFTRIYSVKAHNRHDFHRGLMRLVNRESDAKVQYRHPCFDAFTFFQPFPLVLLNDKVHILPNLKHHHALSRKWASLLVYPEEYSGCRVLAINDMDPIEYIKSYTGEVDAAFAKLSWKAGRWEVDHGLFSETNIMPEVSYIVLRANCPKRNHTIWAPYIAKTSMFSKEKFLKNNCTSDKAVPTNPPSPKVDGLPIFDRASMSVFNFSDGLVVKIQDFSMESVPSMLADLDKLLDQGENGIVFDLSDNLAEQESPCGAYHLLDALFGIRQPFPIVFNITEASKQSLLPLIDASRLSYFNGSNISIYHLSQSKPFYSSVPMLKYKCPQSTPPRGLLEKLEQKRVAVVTNGACQFSCALFIYAIQEFGNRILFKLGGNSKYLSLASTPDLRPLNYNALVSKINPASPNYNDLPGYFPVKINAQITFSIHAYISWKHLTPLFKAPPIATNYVPLTSDSVLKPALIWENIVQTLLSKDIPV